MKWLTFEIQREPGFRFNLIDLSLILFLILLSLIGFQFFPFHYYYLLPLYVGFSFFLFCNVFRIGNKLESIWYITFVLLTFYAFNKPELYWTLILSICEPLKLLLIVYRIQKGSYRGICFKKLNK